jgi:predicted phage terminase large subunit-like protein
MMQVGRPREGVDIYPQAGPQQTFGRTGAEIAVFGGSAGSGKTYALLLEAMRHPPHVTGFDAVMFRRTTVDIRKPGGLWPESLRVFPHAGGVPISHTLEWRWPGKGSIKMAHLEHENTVYDWHGSQVPLICWDELQTFTKSQFFYMLSRNRSSTGIQSWMRATCNADASSWLAEFLSWYWDPLTGYPIPERSGVIRYFTRGQDDSFLWFNSKREAVRATGQPPETVKSFTFVAAKLADNPALMRSDPSYLGNLMLLPQVERERLLNGNWKIIPSAGLYFNRSWCQVIDIAPMCTKIVRGWDLASSEPKDSSDPDWTACTKIGVMQDGRWIVLHHDAFRGSPAEVERRVVNYSAMDGYDCIVSLPQDPGQAGKYQVAAMTRALAGYRVESSPESGDKVTRFGPFSAQAEVGNVLVLRGQWNERFVSQLENFPEGAHDDDADSVSRAYNAIAQNPPMRFDPDELRKLGIHMPGDMTGMLLPPMRR